MPTRQISIQGKSITLDARPDRLDLRDLPYRPPVTSLPSCYPSDAGIARLLPAYLKASLILDQGQEGACTGFGLAAVINYIRWLRSAPAGGEPQMQSEELVSARMLYHLARFYDEWPGEDYDGSSCRGALKGWHRHGVCLETLWPYNGGRFVPPSPGWDADAIKRPLGVYYRIARDSVVDIQAAIAQTGAVYVSAEVHAGWDVPSSKVLPDKLDHSKLPVIKQAAPEGGHAFALVGYNERGFIVQNSWGQGWGAAGFAVLTYEDWVANGTDAWVVGMGVPVGNTLEGKSKGKAARSPRHFVQSAERAPQLAGLPGWLGGGDALADKPHALPEEAAFQHTLVTGNDGRIINCLPYLENATAAIKEVCAERPLQWFKDQNAAGPHKLVFYAHGGLNKQSESIERIRMLAPNFLQNGIYPVFSTWRSGFTESLSSMLQDGLKKTFGLSEAPSRGWGERVTDATDRAIESVAHEVLARSLWSEMKENIEHGCRIGGGTHALAAELKNLQQNLGGTLEIHLVGHSAGSFLCGRLLNIMSQLGLKAKSCTLYAPACDTHFALNFFQTAQNNGTLEALHVHNLSDKRELEDSVGPYRKSLLYLVSRALERQHKLPLIGMQQAFDAASIKPNKSIWNSDSLDSVAAWQAHAEANVKLHLLKDKQVDAGSKHIAASHGCFDNSVAVVGETIRLIRGSPLAHKIGDLNF